MTIQPMTKKYSPTDERKFRVAYDLMIPLIISAVGIFLGSWLLLQYTAAQLTLYTDGYYQRSGDAYIGSLYIVNEGRQPDQNITIAIDEIVSADDLSINYTNSTWTSEIRGGFTYITISLLNPEEGAEINFNTKNARAYFRVEDFTSESGNTYQKGWIEPWLHISRLQLGLMLFVVTISFALGFILGLWKEDVIKRYRI